MTNPEFIQLALGDEEMVCFMARSIRAIRGNPEFEELTFDQLGLSAFFVATRETGRSYGLDGNKALIDSAIILSQRLES